MPRVLACGAGHGEIYVANKGLSWLPERPPRVESSSQTRSKPEAWVVIFDLLWWQVVQAMVKAGDEEESAAALNLLAEVAECPASLIGKSLPDTATWCFRVATAREIALAVRHAAMQVCLLYGSGSQICDPEP